MKNKYDFDKETDRDFLRAAGKMLQERVCALELTVQQITLKAQQDKEIFEKLTGELLVLRRRIFDSKQERLEKTKNIQKKMKKAKKRTLHNENENKAVIEKERTDNQIIELDSEEVVHGLKSCECPHCKGGLIEIEKMFEESSEFDVNTTYYILKRHKRKKYKCSHCKKIVTAPGPNKLKEGGQFSVQMAVLVATDKYEYHLPLERQREKMRNDGLNTSVKTLFSLTNHLYNLLYPLNEMNRQDIIKGDYTCLDESPMSFYNPEKSSGHVWSLSNNIAAYYQFEPTRSQDVAREMLKGFNGVVMTDGYEREGFLGKGREGDHANCWAHVRRYFFDAISDENPFAEAVVELIGELYKVEGKAKDFKELRKLRETESAMIVSHIEVLINENEGSCLPSTLTGKAVIYFYNRRNGLKRFLTNEKIPLDNNAAERRQRCPVMGRKNYLAFRTINGADVGMFFYSMIESCKTNGLNAAAYLQEMALRSLRKEELETPYRYASKRKEEIMLRQGEELKGLEKSSSS